MNYNPYPVYEIINPKTSKVVDVLDMSDFKCYDGLCGGCVDCLLRQAIHYGYYYVRIDRIDGYEELNKDFFKKEEFMI